MIFKPAQNSDTGKPSSLSKSHDSIFYNSIQSDNEISYSFHKIHNLIEDITSEIRTFLTQNFLFFPVFIKINLKVNGFLGDRPRTKKITLPRKKCFKIWDIEMLERELLKIQSHILNFHLAMKNPMNWTFNDIKRFEIKFRNMLSFFGSPGQNYIEKFINEFKKEILPKFNYKIIEEENIHLEEKSSQIQKINRIIQNCKPKNNVLIYFINKEQPLMQLFDTSIESSVSCIGPFNVFTTDTTENTENEVIFYDIQTDKFINTPDPKIKDYICVYCQRNLDFDENFKTHYKPCKLRKSKDSREKKMKDDLINDVPIFKTKGPQFSCKLGHLKCYKSIRKPRTQYIKNEKRAKKLSDVLEQQNFKNSDQQDLKNYFLNDKKNYYLNDNENSLSRTTDSTILESIPSSNEWDETKLNKFFPIKEWTQKDTYTKERTLKILGIKAESGTLKNHVFNQLMEVVKKKITLPLRRSPQTQTKLEQINAVYDDFIHDTPMFSFRNETFMRSKFEGQREFLVEYKADELLKQCAKFESFDLQSLFSVHWRDPKNFTNETDKVIELQRRIESVSQQQKVVKFSNRYTYKLLKYQNMTAEQNPYKFYGLIKCDLEYNRKDQNQNFLTKKFPILPVNCWLEFRHPEDNNIRVPYKMKKNVFDDLNGYTILSDLLFYLLENDIVEIKRIEGYVEFNKKSNVLYSDFFKKMYNDDYRFEDEKSDTSAESQQFKKKIGKCFTEEVRSVFLQNLFRKETQKDMKPEDFEGLSQNFLRAKRISDFDKETFKISKPKSFEMKVFKIMSFVYMSYLNLMSIDSALGYLLNPKNINNVVLSNSYHNLLGQANDNPKQILVEKFSLIHMSFERVIIKYTAKTEDIKKKKLQDLINWSPENRVRIYSFSHIINEYYFLRPQFMYMNYREDETIKSVSPEFLIFNKENFAEAFRRETTPINHCKYMVLNLPFKIFGSDCLYYNKLIFDDGYSSKNDKTVELMLHNLENRFRGEKYDFTEKTFKQIFGKTRKEFKEIIFNQLPRKMNLDGYGVKWNLDHEIPINSVKIDKSLLDQVWNYKNLKPMYIKENLEKGCQIKEGSKNSTQDLSEDCSTKDDSQH